MRGQRHDVLLDTPGFAAAGNRHDVVLLREEPGERELCHGGALGLRQSLQLVDGFEVLLEVARLPAWVRRAYVVRGVLVGGLDVAGEEFAAEGLVGRQPDAELSERGEQFLALPIEGGVLGLQHGDRLYGVSAADRGRACLGQAEGADLSGSPCRSGTVSARARRPKGESGFGP